MKKLALLALIVPIIALTGCSAQVQSIGKSMAISVGGGIERKVTFYAYDGTPVKTWQGRIFVDSEEGDCLHFMIDGKKMAVSGLYTIEEL